MIIHNVLFTTLPFGLMGLGSLLLLISITGMFGIIMQKRDVLVIHLSILFVLIVAQLLLSIYFLVSIRSVPRYLNKMWDHRYRYQIRTIRDIQHEYHCCGFRHIDDRSFPKPQIDENGEFSETCYELYGYTRPCMKILQNQAAQRLQTLGMTMMILCCVQVVALMGVFVFLTHARFTRAAEEGEEITALEEEELLDEHKRLLDSVRSGEQSRDRERGKRVVRLEEVEEENDEGVGEEREDDEEDEYDDEEVDLSGPGGIYRPHSYKGI